MEHKDEEAQRDLLYDAKDAKLQIKKSDDFRYEEGPGCCAQRWILAYMGLWLGIMSYLLNSNMSIAVVCMVKQDDVTDAGGTVVTYLRTENDTNNLNVSLQHPEHTLPSFPNEYKVFEESSFSEASEGSKKSITYTSKQQGEFTWDKWTQSFILSSYYYGYLILQIPGGWLASRFGGKRVIGTCMSLASVVTLLTPVMARTHVYILMIARAALGVCLGMCIPGYCGLIGIWALPTERSRFMALCWFGQMVGAVLGYSTSGLLCTHGFDNGWASVFYVHGLITVLFVTSWWYVIYSTPQQHPRISEAEKRLILQHLSVHIPKNKEKDKVPWRSIFTYVPIYAMFITHICDNWTFYLILTCLPQFMKEVHKFDIQSNGFYSCLPFITLMIGIAFAGVCADFIRSKQWFTVTTVRKIFQISGLTGEATFILVPGYMTREYRGIAIMCLCFATLFQGLGLTGGYSCNSIDIAPRYASVIFAISNTLATIPGIVAPLAVSEITKNQTSEEWRVVFFIAAGVSVFAAITYGLFANSELAPWANANSDTEIVVHISSDTLQHEVGLQPMNAVELETGLHKVNTSPKLELG